VFRNATFDDSRASGNVPVRFVAPRFLRPAPSPAKTFAEFVAVTVPEKVFAPVKVWLLLRNATFGGRFVTEIVPVMFVPCNGAVKNIAFVALAALMARIA